MGFKIPQGERGLMSDKRINQLIEEKEMITNIVAKEPQSDEKVISSGTSSYGFDATIAPEIVSFFKDPVHFRELDPKDGEHFPDKMEHDYDSATEYHLMMPGEFVLARTNEFFKIPDNVLAICMGKSTYARCGLIVNVTPLEPGWEGHVTLEITNTNVVPVRLYFNEGICQFLFYENEQCEMSYRDKQGKYQGQTGITLSR